MIKGVLLDLSGTIHLGPNPLPGAVAAVGSLEKRGIPVRFVTNTSRRTRDTLYRDLNEMGFNIPREHIFTAPLAVRRYLELHSLRPYLLVHPNLFADFQGIPRENPNAVVVGDAEDDFSYEKMNEAFRLLKQGAKLLATGRTRYFEGKDGLELDAGPYVAALEYAAQMSAVVLGKPSADFFLEAAEELGLHPSECVMIGDDPETDVAAAVRAGLHGILVKTGKYREGDEKLVGDGGMVARDVVAAIEWVLDRVGRKP
ncbi:TIGR01458 family HAD-type hydrolase [Geomonas sp. Red32]|uniref:TIGR01458 family HAD-type hydrolase n=1 Tax=Geomonas sp. Red32 TaxID=2912856 RepID=UPI00202CF6CE|nr:TIGR01458 family HAD-type hydrolase [Geomonas sp. Red32]MCM0080172.1 TIGR01458 family HAD-type hydrolase [Geomonas sp. Red32]